LIIERYLGREVLRTCAVVLAVLVLVYGADRFSRILSDAAAGAVSPDRHSPARRGYRWEDEATTEADLARLIANVEAEFGAGLDVLFTHDAPAQVRGLKPGMSGVPWDLREAAKHGRGLLREAVEQTQPAFVVHGHWHRTHHERIGDVTEVFGLSADGMNNSNAHLSIQPALAVSYMS